MEALCLAAKPKLRPLRMIKPVDTRWNSKSHMISRALYLRPVLEDICTKKSLTSQYDTGPLGLTKQEWRILGELSPLLGVCTCLLLMVGYTPQFSFCRHSMIFRLRCRVRGCHLLALSSHASMLSCMRSTTSGIIMHTIQLFVQLQCGAL